MRVIIFTLIMAGALAFSGVLAQEPAEQPSPAPTPTKEIPAQPEKTAPSEQPAALPPYQPAIDVMALNETRPCTFHPKIPVEYLREQHTQQLATSRLSLQLESGESALELEYEDERAQVPVIAAFFDEELSESNITTETYRERKDRSAAISFKVKSTPKNFGAYSILVEHSHISGDGEFLVNTIPLHNLETFAGYRLPIPGMLPGVNRIRLRVRFTDRKGITTTSDGISHFILVEELPALGLVTETQIRAERRSIQGLDLYDGEAATMHTFTLSPAVDEKSITLRIMRRGSRRFSLERMSSSLKDVLEDSTALRSPRLLAEIPLKDVDQAAYTLESLGQRRYRLTIRHALGVSQTLLPFNDQWEYTVEVRHADYNESVDTLVHTVGATIDAESATMSASARGAEAMVMQFEEK